MNWLNGQIYTWEPPLTFATRFSGRPCALLYSGMREQESGEVSYFAVDIVEEKQGNRWAEIETLLETAIGTALPDWIGYLGYGLHETATPGRASVIPFPAFRLARYRHLFRFHHQAQRLEHFYREGSEPLTLADSQTAGVTALVTSLASSLSRDAYLSIIAETVSRIHAGDFYQANITRKFHGEFACAPDSLALFQTLSSLSPAVYSAYIRHADGAILSASPECFLTLDADGTLTTRPIKGSARRMPDKTADEAVRAALSESGKNQAENLMIVDLMRNDLAQVSVPESVTVRARSALHTYATIHHLISTITAKKRADISPVQAVRACFPPGSMTGAPKQAAIAWCAQQEGVDRGVYSGATGWFSRDCFTLSVVIRTLLIQDKTFEFQVGGGIVADSTPEEEWHETLAKARGIAAALGLNESQLAAL